MSGNSKISRREFLKFMAAGATVLTLGSFASIGLWNGKKPLRASPADASAQTATVWSRGPDCPIIAVHATYLDNKKLLLIQGSGNHLAFRGGPFKAVLFDPDLGTEKSFELIDDVFCCGHNHLANGNVLVTGGTLAYDVDTPNGQFHGLNVAYEFNVSSGTFTKLTSMPHGRWYPTQVVLPDGKVVVVGGLDEYGTTNELTEIYNPPSKSFTIKLDPSSNRRYCVGAGTGLPGSGSPCYGGPGNGTFGDLSLYPRMHVMPSGLVLMCGMSNHIYMWNPASSKYTYLGNTIYPNWRAYGTSVLLPLNNIASEKGKVLIAGGTPDSEPPATNTAEIIDFDATKNDMAPQIRSTTPMNFARIYLAPVILPTGEITMFGGTSGSPSEGYVYTPEVYDPVSETWTNLSPATVGRTYHQVSILLADGRVWTASSTPTSTTWEPRTEIFSPWYLFASSRPTISGTPIVGAYGSIIRIPTPDAQNISSVSLTRLLSMTHHYEANQRLIWLQIIDRTSTSVTVSAPINQNVAPPGFYMIHVLDNAGVPSAAKIIRMPGVAAQPYISITSPSAGDTLTGSTSGVSVNIQGRAYGSANTTIQSVTVGIDSQVPANATLQDLGNWSRTVKITTSGLHTIKATAIDTSGNTTSISINITIQLS